VNTEGIFLKITNHWFNEISKGKNFEVRKNDRNYKAGDIINLYVPDSDPMICKPVRITYVLTAEQFSEGIQAGYCVFGWEGI
jgi:hypothetical protein